MLSFKFEAGGEHGHDHFHVERRCRYRVDDDQVVGCLESVLLRSSTEDGFAVLQIANEVCAFKAFNGLIKGENMMSLNLLIMPLHDSQ